MISDILRFETANRPDITILCHEIFEKWLSSNSATSVDSIKPMEQLDNVDERLARLLETNVKSSTVQRSYTEEERKIRDAILSQYGQTSDYEDEYDENEEDNKSKSKTKENGLEKNLNALAIHQAEKEKRERLKEESRKKKEKDKEDKEKQKLAVQEKKEKRKAHAQKGERRR
ncbi:uncharacterized protein [Bemisia tabaci]